MNELEPRQGGEREQISSDEIVDNPLLIAAIAAAASGAGVLAYRKRSMIKNWLRELRTTGPEGRILQALHHAIDSGESDSSLIKGLISRAFSAVTKNGRMISPRRLHLLDELAKKTQKDIIALSPSMITLANQFGIDADGLELANEQADTMPLWLNIELRKALVNRGYGAVPVREGQKGWDKIEGIREASWPSELLREHRHGGRHTQNYLAIEQGEEGAKQIVGYLSYMVLEGSNLENIDLDSFTFEDAVAAQVQVTSKTSLEDNIIMLTGSGTKGATESLDPAPVYAAMCAILDLAKQSKANPVIIVPAFSKDAVQEQLKNGGNYEDYWFGDDRWRQTLSVFGMEGPVNPAFMSIDTPVDYIVKMLREEDVLRYGNDGSSLFFPERVFCGRKIIDTNSLPAPIFINAEENNEIRYTCEVPCGWLIFDSKLGIGLGHEESLLRNRLPLVE